MTKWKAAPVYSRHEVSDDGQVARIDIHGRSPNLSRIKHAQKRNGYLAIKFHVYVHRLVWEAFNGTIPSGKEINHIDGNRANNRLSNLQLVTRSENMRHCHRVLSPSLNRVSGIKHHKAKLTPDDVMNILVLRQSGLSLKKIAQRYNVSDTAILLIFKGKNWRHVTGIKTP